MPLIAEVIRLVGGPRLNGTGQFFEMLGFRPGRRHALLGGWAEAGGGLVLALGLLTPLGVGSRDQCDVAASIRPTPSRKR